MTKKSFQDIYNFDWESFDIILSGTSSIDDEIFIRANGRENFGKDFWKSYGFDLEDPIEAAELFGIFQESMQFIKRFFLLSGNPDGLDLEIPASFYTITDIAMLVDCAQEDSFEGRWASVILKVMHTIIHTDKDLRYHYFSTIQTQIFDRFYKFLHRDDDNNLFLMNKGDKNSDKIELISFETKSNKTRESTIIKLLHKKDNVAEELFDRVGVRLITKRKSDVLRVLNFLKTYNVIIPNNIKPSRSLNTLFNLERVRQKITNLHSSSLDESTINKNMEKILDQNAKSTNNNEHSSEDYSAIHFTCRQLIKYQNPFLKDFNRIRSLALNEESESELVKQILNIDTNQIAQSIRFFYPFEVQITDFESHKVNTEGEASHSDYKKSQLSSAMTRLFSTLLVFDRKD
ncbi:MAG: TIGR04552 family protein [Bacteriovoracaceae bacterium]|jgi:uncharacterized protein (TIGR04562 family)|nr:TIGR04552 family protein [Bacteriovoracaceae bacterium]